MGMDLRAKNDSTLHYNWAGWRGIIDISNLCLPYLNDGEEIPAALCEDVAKAIEANAEWYNKEYGFPESEGGYGLEPAAKHAAWWRNSGGVEVW